MTSLAADATAHPFIVGEASLPGAAQQSADLDRPHRYDVATGRFVEICWKDALSAIAPRLRALDHPSQALFAASSRATGGAAFLLQLFARTFGTNNILSSPEVRCLPEAVSARRIRLGMTPCPSEGFLSRLDRAFAIESPRDPGYDVGDAAAAIEEGWVRAFVGIGSDPFEFLGSDRRTRGELGCLDLSVCVTSHLTAMAHVPARHSYLLPASRSAAAADALGSHGRALARLAGAVCAGSPVDWSGLAEFPHILGSKMGEVAGLAWGVSPDGVTRRLDCLTDEEAPGAVRFKG